MRNLIILIIVIAFVQHSFAQVTIGSSVSPDPNSVLELISNNKKGLLLPRLELQSLISPAPLTEHVEGMVVYNTGTNIEKGYYYNDGNQWIHISNANATAWNDVTNQKPAVSTLQDIYQLGKVGVGSPTIDPHVQLQVTSNSKGILLPEMSTNQMNDIGGGNTNNLPNGLLIYNSETGCFNYFESNAKQWLSLCGSHQPSKIEFGDCTSAKIIGSITAGSDLNAQNIYILPINVVSPGIYRIDVTTENGYLFSASGTFTNVGAQLVSLIGQGRAIAASPPGGDPVKVSFNSINAILPPTCNLPKPIVEASSTILNINCTNVKVYGTYEPSSGMTAANYVEVPYTSIQYYPSEIISITTQSQNGVAFTATTNISTGSGIIRLMALGTSGSGSGIYTYNFTIPGTTNTCSFNIEYKSTFGTEANPAKSCYYILQADSNAPDGLYWIKQSSGGAIRTYCDMTNGGYTMLQSFSEYAIYGAGAPGSNATAANIYNRQGFTVENPQGNANAQNNAAEFPFENFRLSKSTMQGLSLNANLKNIYRVRIVQDANNLANNNDDWANDNYWTIDFTSAANDPLNSTWGSSLPNVKVAGKMFGKDFGITPQSSSINLISFNGVSWTTAATSFGMWNYPNNAMVISLSAGDPAAAKIPNSTFSYTSKTIDNIPYTVNNLNIQYLNDFGFPYQGENQINHAFGKCGNISADDYQGNAQCTYQTTIRSPHRFNLKGGNYQGRYIQWFVK